MTEEVETGSAILAQSKQNFSSQLKLPLKPRNLTGKTRNDTNNKIRQKQASVFQSIDLPDMEFALSMVPGGSPGSIGQRTRLIEDETFTN
jgi:hypothetical protein